MGEMAGRIKTVRSLLYDDLVKLNPDKDWTFVKRQIGMFSFTGLNPAQVENMTAKHAIYMTKAGRHRLCLPRHRRTFYFMVCMYSSQPKNKKLLLKTIYFAQNLPEPPKIAQK